MKKLGILLVLIWIFGALNANACTTEWVSMGPGEPFKQVTHCEPLQVNDTPVAQPGRNSMNEFYQGMNQFNKGVQDFGEAYGKGN